MHTAERKQLSNLTLFCFIQQVSRSVVKSSGPLNTQKVAIKDNYPNQAPLPFVLVHQCTFSCLCFLNIISHFPLYTCFCDRNVFLCFFMMNSIFDLFYIYRFWRVVVILSNSKQCLRHLGKKLFFQLTTKLDFFYCWTSCRQPKNI